MDVTSRRLVGTWRLCSLQRFRDGEFYRFPMGDAATGRLFYSAEGLVAAFLMSAAWRAGDASPTWDHFMSYSGRWSLSDGSVSHRLDAASISQLIGQDLIRHVSWTDEGDLVLITDGHIAAGGQHTTDTLVWRREAAG